MCVCVCSCLQLCTGERLNLGDSIKAGQQGEHGTRKNAIVQVNPTSEIGNDRIGNLTEISVVYFTSDEL